MRAFGSGQLPDVVRIGQCCLREALSPPSLPGRLSGFDRGRLRDGEYISWLCLPFIGGETQYHWTRQHWDFLLPSASH